MLQNLTCESRNYYYMKIMQGRTNYNINYKQIMAHHICQFLILINHKFQVPNNKTFHSFVTQMKNIIDSWNNLHVLDYN
jgi:hypothetical protein